MSYTPLQKLAGAASAFGVPVLNGTSSPAYAKTNLAATVDPTSSNDSTQGYIPFSVWLNTISNAIFMCVVNTTSGAIWERLDNITSGLTNILSETTTISNSFAVGNVLRRSGAGYVLAQADTSSNSQGVVGVIQTASATQYTVVYEGVMPWASHGFTVGSPLYLSSVSAGAITSSAPTSPALAIAVALAIDANRILVYAVRPDAAIPNNALALASAATFKANLGGTSAPPSDVTLIQAANALDIARADVPSATTTNIGAAATNYVRITGTTTITAFDTMPAGIVRRVLFAATLTLTQNATTLILPGAANITTAAGDVAVFISEGSGNWRCIDYMPTSGSTVIPAASVIQSPVRQTALGGPVTSAGLPDFLPATSGSLSLTSQNISSTAPLVVTSANGFDLNGAVNRIGISMANLTWASLTASSTLYLYVDIASTGVMTPGFTTLAPAYQFGGARSTANGQFTFNIQEMSATVGNGTVASQAYRVYVGEAMTSGSAVTSTVAYAYQGLYDSGFTNTLPGNGVLTTKNANIGRGLVEFIQGQVIGKCLTAEAGFSVGDITPLINYGGAYSVPTTVGCAGNAVFFAAGASGWTLSNKSSGVPNQITPANWAWKVKADRGKW